MSAWTPYHPSDDAPWNLRRVVHLHRRVIFGACRSEIERDLAGGPHAAVSRVLDGTVRGAGVPEGFEPSSTVIGAAAVDSGNPGRLKAWWLYRCLFSPNPLQERLTLMWHNHFATSNLKIDDLRQMKQQNDTLRKYALAPFGKLLHEMIVDPALLTWLDAPSNRAGRPNENLARELMELFTLGIGNYTEQDVKEAARALSGWSVRRGRFSNVQSHHDQGEKTVLGHTGKFNAENLVAILLDQPAVARRLAWRLTSEFFGEAVVDDAALHELADGLRAHNLDVRWAVETILHSQLFFSDANIRTRICDPVTFLLAPLRAIECWRQSPSTFVLADWIERLGQNLFYPPNVGGWPGGRNWLSTRTVVARANYAAALADGRLAIPAEPPDVVDVLPPRARSGDVRELIRAECEVLLGEADEKSINAVAEELSTSADVNATARKALVDVMSRPEAQLN